MTEQTQDAGLQGLGYTQELKRELGLLSVVGYGIMFVFPLAPVTVYGLVYNASAGMTSMVYLIGLIAIFFTALSYAVMVREFPICGSVYAYVQRAVNPHVGFVAGWAILLSYLVLPALIVLIAALWANLMIPSVSLWIWTTIFVVFNMIINVVGISIGKRINLAVLIVSIVAVFVFVVVGSMYVTSHGGFTIDSFYQAGTMNWAFIATAASLAMTAFLGFDGITTLAEETKNPRVTISRAIPIVLAAVGACFLLLMFVADNILISGPVDSNTGFFDKAVAAANGSAWLGNFIAYTIIVGSVLAAGGIQMAGCRVLYGMGRDKVIPKAFGKIHERFKTPYVAAIATATLTLILALALGLDLLASVVSFGALTAFAMLNLAVIWYFFVKKAKRTLSGVFLYLLIPAIGTAVVGYIWWGLSGDSKIIGLIWMAIGILYGAYSSRLYSRVPEALQHFVEEE